MAALPSQTPTVDAIYKHYEVVGEERRAYLGGSEVGRECRRRLWYGFRWVARPSFEGRIKRLFETGHREEERIKANLRAISITIEGDQHEVVACRGHMRGHFDGVALGFLEAPKTWHLLECKTANKKRFDDLVRNGCAKAMSVYEAQCQAYMGLEKLTRAALVVVCKDDDRIHIERIRFDATAFDALMSKANAIISAESPPERIGKTPSYYECKMCPFVDNCHGRKIPEVNCRTCAHSSPADDGQWTCARGLDMTRPVCAEHIFIPGLLHWATPIDGHETWVLYEAGGSRFVNCAATGFCGHDVPHYSSRDITK